MKLKQHFGQTAVGLMLISMTAWMGTILLALGVEKGHFERQATLPYLLLFFGFAVITEMGMIAVECQAGVHNVIARKHNKKLPPWERPGWRWSAKDIDEWYAQYH